VIVEQRAYAGIGRFNVVRGYRYREIFARGLAQIVDFAIADPGLAFGIAPRLVRGSDQCVITLVGNGENDAAVPVLEYIAVLTLIFALHHDMTALDQPQFRCVVAAIVQGGDGVNPGTGRVDQHPCPLGPRIAIVPEQQVPVIGPAVQSDAFRARPDLGAPACCVARSERNQPGILDPAIGIGKALFQAFLQRIAAMVPVQIDALGRRQDITPAQMIVKEQPQAEQPGRTHALVHRQDESHRPDDMGCGAQQHFPLLERLAHQVEFIMFKIAQTAMDQLGAGG